MIPGETVVVEKEVVKEVRVPGETVVVRRRSSRKVPVEVVVEVVKEVEVEVVVEKEVVKVVEVEVVVERRSSRWWRWRGAGEGEGPACPHRARPYLQGGGFPRGTRFPMLFIGQPLVRPGPDSTIEPG